MFGFLNSAVLIAAAATLIPLIIHLFSRRRVKVVEFSSLRHLKEMQKRQLRRLRIRQWLLLLLRMLIILAVVMAFARPTLKEGLVGSHAAVSAVILIDNSASMQRYVSDGLLFDIARDRAAELLKTFSQTDEVSLIGLDRSTDLSGRSFTSAAGASEELARVTIGGGRADIQEGLEQALKLLGGAINLNQEVYLISDLQRTSLPESDILRGSDVNLYLVNLPLEENENLGVVALDFGGQLIRPGHDFDLRATVHNYGATESGDKIASLFLDGNRVAQTDFSVTAAGETSVHFTRSVAAAGFHSGFVEISDDRFPGDNRQYFSFRIPEQFNLLIINGDDAVQFLTLALVPPTLGGQYWSVKEADPDDLAGVDFNDYDVIVLAGTPNLSDTYVGRIDTFVRRGKSLFFTYGGETDIDNFNARWSQTTMVTYDQAVPLNFSREGYYSFEAIDLDHPIFSVFDFEDGRPPQIKFFALPKFHIAERARTLISFTGNFPALVEADYGLGKVITFTAPMSPRYSDLVSHGFFVPLVSRIAEYLASDLSSLEVKLYAGSNLTRALSSAGTQIYAVDLIAPDSSLIALPPEEDNGALVVRTGPLTQAGIYRIAASGRDLDCFALNIDPLECDLAAADIDQFGTALGASEIRQLELNQPMAASIAQFRVGRELWQIFLWIALILLAIEMLLGRATPAEE